MSKNGNIIIAADDFGLSKKANTAILELVGLGKIQRVAVMADGVFGEDEVRILLDSGVKIDLHLDLPDKIFSRHGEKAKNILRIIDFLRFYFFGQNRQKRVRKEWYRQLEKFKEIFGKAPDGINSHQHVHFFPSYFSIAVEISLSSGDRWLRFSQKNSLKSFRLVPIAIFMLSLFNKKLFKNKKIQAVDYLFGLDWTDHYEKIKTIFSDASVELVIHPERDEEMRIIKQFF